MCKTAKTCFICCLLLSSFLFCKRTNGQTTSIRGFADVTASYDKNKTSFGFDEQDLFITSQLNDRFSFLGESVFKYTPSSATNFNVSIERLVVKYNYYGNNNIIIGKVHTPINYWNDTYHHGRVFYPTVTRPLLFDAEIIPLHTTGVNFQGHDIGDIKFGYDVMIGNGLGSTSLADNDKYKSITTAIHIKPVNNMRIGASYYHDVISKGANMEGKIINWKVTQQLFTGSFAFFGKKLELLAESTLALNHTDTTGTKQTLASYLYAGYRIKDKLIPYIRVDDLHYQTGELLFTKDNARAYIVGLRYQINYLTVTKLEFQHTRTELDNDNKISLQIALGF